MRYRRSFVVLALIALVATAIPATAALIGGLKPSYVDPRIAQRLSAQPTADVVIGFRTAPTNADVIALHKSGFTGPFLRFDIVPAVAATATAAAMSAVRSNPRVERVEFDAELPYTLDRATAVGRVKPLWNATYRSGGVDVPGGITGKGVTVALFDSGIDARHPDLLHKDLASKTGKESVTMANFAILGRTTGNELAGLLGPDVDSITGDSTGTDLLGEESEQDNLIQANVAAVPMINSDNGGHGTHCAGVIAGRGKSSDGKFKGVAWRAKLIGLSGGEVLSVARGIAGMDWMYLNAAKYGIRVMSNSWGPGALEDQPNSILRNAIERLVNDKAISVVFAAGNNGGDGTAIQTTYASNAPSVISVANYFDRTGWVDASSSRGLAGNPNTWPDLAAPGTQIISTAMVGGSVTHYGSAQDGLIQTIDPHGDPIVVPAPTPNTVSTSAGGQDVIVGDYASMTGTSMAAPFVSGVVALLLEANPSLTPAQVKEILRATANMPVGHDYANDGYAIGTGVVDAAEAVAVALRIKDGDSLAAALGNASLDLTSNPAKLNQGSGPVTDNSIPLVPGAPSPVTASGRIYQQGLVDPFLVGQPTLVGGQPVDLSARTIHSSDPGIVLGAGTFEVNFYVWRSGSVARGPYLGTVTADDADWQSTYTWTPPKTWSGAFRLIAELSYNSAVYQLFDIPFRVQKAAA